MKSPRIEWRPDGPHAGRFWDVEHDFEVAPQEVAAAYNRLADLVTDPARSGAQRPPDALCLDPRPGGAMSCLFCDRTALQVIGSSANWDVRLDNFPAATGHALLIPKRHVASLFDLNGDEEAELPGVRRYARELVEGLLGHTPDGWTIGVNEGRAAGRSIDHLHEHLIPRYDGDVPDARGGIRQCAPNCDPDKWMKAEVPH